MGSIPLATGVDRWSIRSRMIRKPPAGATPDRFQLAGADRAALCLLWCRFIDDAHNRYRSSKRNPVATQEGHQFATEIDTSVVSLLATDVCQQPWHL